MRVGGGDRRCVSSETDHRSESRFLAWPHRSLAAQRLKEAKVDGAMTREMGHPHQSEGIAAQARAAPRRHLRDGAGIGADPPPYHTASLDQLSISLCHVGNCSRGRPPTPTSDARCGDAGDDGLRRVRCGSGKGRGGGRVQLGVGMGSSRKKRFKEGPSRQDNPQDASLIIGHLDGFLAATHLLTWESGTTHSC